MALPIPVIIFKPKIATLKSAPIPPATIPTTTPKLLYNYYKKEALNFPKSISKPNFSIFDS